MNPHGVALRARANEHFAYSGRSLLVTNLDGFVIGQGLEGFYFENTRLLSCLALAADGKPLRAVSASPVDGHAFLAYYEVPELSAVPKGTVYVQAGHFLDEGMITRLRLESYDVRASPAFDLAIRLESDFADLEEVADGRRRQTGAVETSWDGEARELLVRYRHPGLDRAVAIRVEAAPGPVRYDGNALFASLDLAPHRPVELRLAIEPIFDGARRPAPPPRFRDTATPLGQTRERLRDETPRLTTTNPTVARAWLTATRDLASLPLGFAPGPAAPIAGVPLYQQFFGRDTLTTGWQGLLATPTLLRDALRANAALQGTVVDDWRDEEPGKLIHQARRGPLSVLGEDPYLRYYGDYATPPDFLIMVGQYLLWTGDVATVRDLLPAARKAEEWCERDGDLDGDGFLEYVTRSPMGIKNQGWKDSWEGIVDDGGNVVANPIATCEIQAYWYVGLRQVAAAFLAAGDLVHALALYRKAAALKARFNRRFWMEDAGFYALALGPDKRPVRSIASNPGHLLACGIVPRERARRVAARLMAPDLFSGWGIRTLSDAHPAYNPFSYHLGSVWPVENGTFAFGFARYGFWDALDRLAEGLFAATDLFVDNRLPEALAGLPRDDAHPFPGIYPESNAPQSWSASLIVVLVQALLGLRPLAPLGLLLVDPHLPPWLPDLRLEGIRVGAARVDLDLWRTRLGRTRYRVRRDGPVRVLCQPTPDAPEATLGGRVAALARSLLPG